MQYKLIIFDLDGTLLDTILDLTSSVNYAMRELHLPERSKEEVLSFVGNGNRMLMARCLEKDPGDEETDRALKLFHAYYHRHYADETTAYPGISELLRHLKAGGYRLAVVSNKADYAVQDLCRKYFEGTFDFVLGDKDGIPRKPAPEPIQLVLESLGMERSDAVYIGDSEVDIQTAANALLPCISVSWGFRSKELLEAAGAQTIISRPEELSSCI